MSSTQETGHAKNVANFEDLISFCTGYGATYQPNKASIKLAALITLFTQSQAVIADVTAKLIIFHTATNTRQDTFASLKALSTKLINALQTTDATDKTIEDAKSINRKIQGTRASKVPSTTTDPNNPITITAKTVSASQQSYDQQIEHFSKLIELLKNEPSYAPNETELQITTLVALHTTMKAANTTVTNTYTDISNSRITRNDTLYKKDAGLHDIAQEVKKYIKSVFGATSPQYKQVSTIKFTSPR